jgi:S1-C subfamily serine protease
VVLTAKNLGGTMDDQQPTTPQPPAPEPHDPDQATQQHRYAPAPAAAPTPYAGGDPAVPPVGDPGRPHRGRRVLATVTATALVAGVGGVGAGYALGHGLRTSTPQAAAGSGQSNVSTDGSGATVPIPGNGDWSWSGGQGGLSLPTDPGTGVDPFGTGSSSPSTGSSTSKASGSQLTGLVRIATTLKYDGGRAAGTGMVLTSDGEVVTNHHVVAGATSIKVTVMSSGRSYTASVVGTDTQDDVAVLQLAGASGLSTVTPDTDGVSVGDAVTAVGDANGTVGYLSAADGEVMATRQAITTQSEANVSGQRLTGLIEISADVISGDSGGATYDDQGEVVGMTTAASSGSSDVVGYAVPIAKVLRVAGDLESGVTSSRYTYGAPAFLGVGLGATGTTVQGVYSGTPAARAGLAAGDRITAIGSTRVGTSAALRRAVATYSPGDRVGVTWTDAQGTSHTATVTLTDGPVR